MSSDMRSPGQTVGHISTLHALRGMAAAGVVWLHVQERWPQLGFGDWAITGRLFLLVDFFFLLSGIVLAHVYQTRFRQELSRGDVVDFLVARLARCWPMIVLASLLAFAVNGLSANVGTQEMSAWMASYAVLVEIFALSGWFDDVWLNPPSWSLTAEFSLYLVAPWLIQAVARLDRKWLWPLAVALPLVPAILVPLASRLFVSETGSTTLIGDVAYFGPEAPWFWFVKGPFIWLRAMPMFLAGLAIYGLWRQGSLTFAARPLGFSMSLVAVAVIMGVGAPRFLILLAFICLAMSALAVPSGRTFWIDARLPSWLGDISLSLYLLHFPLLVGIEAIWMAATDTELASLTRLSASLMVIVALGIVIIASTASHRIVEAPARRLLRRWWQARRGGAGRSVWSPRTPELAVGICLATVLFAFPAGILTQGWILHLQPVENASVRTRIVERLSDGRGLVLEIVAQDPIAADLPLKVDASQGWIAITGANRRNSGFVRSGQPLAVTLESIKFPPTPLALTIRQPGRLQTISITADGVSR